MATTPAPPRTAVLDAIRRDKATVGAIATELGVTDNAVRLHLSSLERDGLIARRGTVRSGRPGQPAAEYELTPDGEVSLSRAYPAALTALVATLGARLDARALRAALGDAGARMAGEPSHVAGATLAQRAQDCAALLRDLGGSVTVERGRGAVTLVGDGCPLAGAVRESGATCTLIESFLEHRFGVRAEQLCRHGAHPACRFRLTA